MAWRYSDFFKILKVAVKKNAMVIYGGNEIARLKNSLPDPETGDMYTKLRTKLKGHFSSKKKKKSCPLIIFEDEVARGRNYKRVCREYSEKVKECEFGDTFDERILEHIIQTTENKKLIGRAVSKQDRRYRALNTR